MSTDYPGRPLVAVVLMVVFVLFAVLATGSSMAAVPTSTLISHREAEPVIVMGAEIRAFVGAPVGDLFVYAYGAGDLTQIPVQVDEVTATGEYTSTEDGLLDANDEIVFMARDLADRLPDGDSASARLGSSGPWYELEVADPFNPDEKGWVYLVNSSELVASFTEDYVDYDLTSHRVQGTTYELGLAIPHPYFDYLSLQDGVDILDRTKTRMCFLQRFCPIDEESLPGDPQIADDLVVDGPVRVVVRGGKGLAYHSMVSWSRPISGLDWIQPHMRFSMDFSEEAVGATLYNAAAPDGVTVDGQDNGESELIEQGRLSTWFQLSSNHGTLVQAGDTSSMGGTQTNYYEDDETSMRSDTGDGKRYGENGVFVMNPNKDFTYTFALYSLEGRQPNVGAAYADYFSQPLKARAFLMGLPLKISLPVILK